MKLNQKGSANLLIIPLVLSVLLLFASVGFGFWAFGSRNDYKNNVDEKIATAVEIAREETSTEKDNEFIEREKKPLQTYAGPSSYGSVSVKYPKTWSAYVDEQGSGSTPVDGYFHPNFVPGLKSDTSFALRVQVTDRTFDTEVKAYDARVKSGETRARAYKAKNVKGSVGLRFDGEIEGRKQGTLIMLKLRDKTLKIWTEADQFKDDLTNHILANLTFEP